MKISIEIESRESLIRRAQQPFPKRTVLISIADTDLDFVTPHNMPEHILQLKFNDVGNEIFDEVLRGQPPAAAKAMAAAYHIFNEEQAKEIAAFIKSIFGQIEVLVCQCEHGQSRSAAIATAVTQFFYGDGIEIFADERYYPNKLVYHKTLQALQRDTLE